MYTCKKNQFHHTNKLLIECKYYVICQCTEITCVSTSNLYAYKEQYIKYILENITEVRMVMNIMKVSIIELQRTATSLRVLNI